MDPEQPVIDDPHGSIGRKDCVVQDTVNKRSIFEHAEPGSGDHRLSPMVISLHLDLLGNPKSVDHHHAKVPDGAFLIEGGP